MTLAAVRRIVVGVDGSAESATALRWACREARLRGAQVHAVRAWEAPQRWVAGYAWSARVPGQPTGVGAARDDLRRMVHSVMEPGVPVQADVVEGLPARVLLDQAIGAELLVLGSASHAQTRVAGPVVRACVSRAPCPVVVVGGEDASEEPATQHAVVAATAGGWIADA